MNHNKVHNKIFVLLTLPFSKLVSETVPALVVLAVIALTSFLPIPTIINPWSCLVALIVVIIFSLMIKSNAITFDITAVEEAPVMEIVEAPEEEPDLDDIVLGMPPAEPVEREPELSQAVEIVEVEDDPFDFGMSLKETYDRGDVKDMAKAGANKTKNKADLML